jgi:hypothetical protein
MAATIEEIRNKLTLYYLSPKMPRINNNGSWFMSRIFNFEPFSLRKTATTLDQIFEKLGSQRKGQHNKKYLQSFFPYYVFYDVILDLDGRIVLFISKERVNNGSYSTRYVLHVKKEFYDAYKDVVDILYMKWGGANTNMDYRARLEIHEGIDDIYFLFHKLYSFDGIAQRKGFKDVLMGAISQKFSARKSLHLQHPEGLPF